MRTLEALLEQWIDTTAIWIDGRVYKISTIINAWPENPLAADLANCQAGLDKMKLD